MPPKNKRKPDPPMQITRATETGTFTRGAKLKVGDRIIRHNVTGSDKMKGEIIKIIRPRNKILMSVFVEGSEYEFRVLHSDIFYIDPES